jgi:gamma-glutamyltranspeptidase/glutathione hydrolase
MLLLHLAGMRKTLALDGSSRAPSRANIEVLENRRQQLVGHGATTVPSTPAALAYAAKTYGTLPLSRLIEPAIRIADQGFKISQLQARLLARQQERWPEGSARSLFFDGGKEGELFCQPALAQCLRTLSRKGIEELYTGKMARLIERDMKTHGGYLRRDDLALIPWPIERRPISCRFEGLRVLTFPPPGAGRTLLEMLNILGHFPEKKRNPDQPNGVVLLSEVIRRAQLDRRDRPYDPNFYPQVEARRMTSIDYAKLAAKQIQARVEPHKSKPAGGKRAAKKPTVAEEQRGETTHLSVMDRQGNVVGLTQSIERVYGAMVSTPELGFLYNNYMSAFDYQDITNPYYLRPNAVPWASVAPTIVIRGKRPWLVLGSPGSERITTAILLVLLRLLRDKAPLDAVVAPRFFCSAAGRVALERAWMRDDIPQALGQRGFTVVDKEPLSFYLGCVQLVLRQGKTLVGVADPRRDGAAAGASR